jgi:hypothetical protein
MRWPRFSPPSVFTPPPTPPADHAFCPSCQRFREYSIIAGSKAYHLPDRRFCACGEWLTDLPEEESEAS